MKIEDINYPEKLYYSIGEVATLLDVNASLIRFWEKEFTQFKPKKNRRGNRVFTVKDIEQLKLIHKLVKDEGHTLEGAKRILRSNKSEAEKQLALQERLQGIKGFLKELRSELDSRN